MKPVNRIAKKKTEWLYYSDVAIPKINARDSFFSLMILSLCVLKASCLRCKKDEYKQTLKKNDIDFLTVITVYILYQS